LGAPLQKTADTCGVSGYHGGTQEINHLLTASLTLANQHYPNQSFIVLDMKRDIIVGKEFLARHHILVDCANERLINAQQAPAYIASHSLNVPKRVLLPAHQRVNPEHQEDADRRDDLMDQEDKKTRGSTLAKDRRSALATMERELSLDESTSKPSPRYTIPQKRTTTPTRWMNVLDICTIGSVPFGKHLRHKDSELFTTSIYEIDQRLVELRSPQEPEIEETEEEMLRRTVPVEYHDLLDVFSKKASEELPPHRPYDHKIELEGSVPFSYSPLYKMTEEELEALKEYLTENLRKGYIESSSAPFASPILFVRKGNGSLRLCHDFRKLNALTRKDRYPLPLLDEVLSRMSKAKVFTKLDIRAAFNKIRMDKDSEELTSFRTRYGQYKCKVLPFGLCNGPATYQRYMNDILFDYLDDFCTAYLDDIIVYSSDPLEHAEHVRKVLLRLRAAGLQVDIKKCEFNVTRTKFLGFILTTEGVEVDPEKIAVIKN
jgi:hypothetical protein